MSDENVRCAVSALRGQRFNLDDVRVPTGAGLFAIYGTEETWKALGLNDCDGRPLYVGKAEVSLHSRDLRAHFSSGKTGQSTVRRSLAALLRDALQLTPSYRHPERRERATHYGLEAPGDDQLTEWMGANLKIAFWDKPAACENLADVERAVIDTCHPPLNLKDNESPWKERVAAARRAMATDLSNRTPDAAT